MPIYEYECHGCRRRVSVLVMRPSTAPPPTCPRCGSDALTRVMSRFVTVKSEEARLESLADAGDLGDVDEPVGQLAADDELLEGVAPGEGEGVVLGAAGVNGQRLRRGGRGEGSGPEQADQEGRGSHGSASVGQG